MAVSYEQIEVDGVLIDSLTDPESGLRIRVRRLGAEMVSLALQRAGQWIGFLYRDGQVTPAAGGWNNHATVMGYFLHRLKNERSSYRGHQIRGGTHSFVRHKTFGAPVFDGSSLTYRLEPEQIQSDEYPLKVALALSYTIEKDSLFIGFEFENREQESSAHVSFGLHPGFAVTSLEGAEVKLPPGKYIRHLAPGNFLSGEQEQITFAGGPMPFLKTELPDSFLLELADVQKPVVSVCDPASGRVTRINLGDAPYLTLWSDGHAFICVEPCWGLPDHHDQRPFEHKLGIQEIAPGSRLSAGFRIIPELGLPQTADLTSALP